MTVSRGDLEITVNATGTLEPVNSVDIGCEISGSIEEVHVDFNERVEAGDVLITLDTDELEAQVARSRASLAVSQADLRQAEATLLESKQTLARIQHLRERKTLTQQDLDTAIANVARAEASLAGADSQIMVARATLDGDLTKLRKSRVHSPIDGMVLTRAVEPGQTIAATFQTPILLTLAEDLSQMKLLVDIDEADVGTVREGQKATFAIDAYPGENFPARITSLRYAPKRTQDVVTYEAVLEVDNSSLKLRPGMTAVADIVTARAESALLVPNAALRFTPESDTEFEWVTLGNTRDAADGQAVWILRDNKPYRIKVETGRSDGRRTEIISGELSPGTAIIVDTIGS
ncbi:efflux RND transporter periplasmic adaptor subunit [Stratiformator vulcanicus]|uniref:efflux RND transporter periplasmic adaptor subunit n=1 Tax=Stratiformator vulcanicus TaxID=2527980 RepID=UPI0028775D08|nr:efflux RND transporter periplasmic adaptor subunit [Stratiformator vulcanicus]